MERVNVRLIILALLISLLAACAAVPMVNQKNLKKASEINAKLGLGYMQEGHDETALHKLLKAIKQDPENADAHQYLAVLYNRL
ncbi:MAG TPA: tetratricopeptide repeat protein, partial [Gammaproteobacteria bacterium]|nr:tetratricopeptide repeat protein [Gammaproteobacteria bacterium]